MRYDAFISYRHAELDMFVAKKVHKGLETFKVPHGVAKKTGKKKISRVFRDQEELPIGSDLGNNISGALQESEYLIVICSPRTKDSYWVQTEIATFIKMHGREHILAVLVEGEPNESFPEQLLVDENGNPVEPLAADVRGENQKEVNRKLKTEILRLAAPLLHCSYDDLRQRHRERRLKKMVAAVSAVAVFAVAFGLYSAYNTAMIRQNFKEKQVNQSKYLATTSRELLEAGDREAAVLVALEALPTEDNDRPYVAEAQNALSEALHAYNMGRYITMDRQLHHELPVKEIRYSTSGEKLVTIDQGGYVYVWNVEDGERLACVSPEISETGFVSIPNGAFLSGEDTLLIAGDDDIRAYDFSGDCLWTAGEGGSYNYAEYDGEQDIAIISGSDEFLLVCASDGRILDRVKNDLECSYSAELVFSQDHRKLAVSHLNTEEGVQEGYVTVYDIATKEKTDYVLPFSYIIDMRFTRDGDLAIAGNMYDMIFDMDAQTSSHYVIRLSCDTGEVVWEKEIPGTGNGFDDSYTFVRARTYTDDSDGVTYDQVIACVSNTVYTYDALTGEQMCAVSFQSNVEKMLVSATSCFGYIGQVSGDIDIVDLNTGQVYTDSVIGTGKNLRDVQLMNGVLAIRTYLSPDVTLMKYAEGKGIQELDSFDDSIIKMSVSPNETYYAVHCYGAETVDSYNFYRVEDDSAIETWSPATDGYETWAAFTDDEHFAVVSSEGEVIYYEMTTGEVTTYQTFEDSFMGQCYVTPDKKYALIYSDRAMVIFDLESREIVRNLEVENYLYGVIMNGDGTAIFATAKEIGLCMVDPESGEMKALDMEGSQIVNSIETQKAFAVCDTMPYVAFACSDNQMRVWDYEKEEMVATFPFASKSSRFVSFSQDGKLLRVQGDDYYFRVYNLETQQFDYISMEQYDAISELVEKEGEDTLTIVTASDIIIAQKDTYQRIAEPEYGIAYLSQTGAVYCKAYRTLYRFPYLTLEDLIEEAKVQFEGSTLTQQQRIQYNVD